MLFITKYFQVINLTVPSTWIASILSFIVAFFIIKFKYGNTTARFLGDAMFYFVIVWKLSVVLTDFTTVIQFPLSILYFNGGAVGVYLGIFTVGIFLFYNLKKNRMSQLDVFGLFIGSIITLSSYQVFVAVFNPGPFGIRLGTIAGFLIFMLLVVTFVNRFKEMPKELAMLLIGLHLFMSVLQPAGLFQTPTIVVVIIGLFMMIINKKNFKMEAEY